MRSIIFFILTFLTYVLCYANIPPQLPKVRIQASEDGGELKIVKWPRKIKPIWKMNSEGGSEFFWSLQLQIPGNIGISSIQAQRSEIGVRDNKINKINEQTVYVGLKSVTDKLLVTLKNNKLIELNVQLIFQKTIILEQDCEELNLKLVQTANPATLDPKLSQPLKNDQILIESDKTDEISDNQKSKNEIPFYLSYKCEAIPTGIRLAVTIPMEISWYSNSLFESKGKGKNWKNFDIGVQINSLNKQEIGTIEFEWNSKRYGYQILLEKSEIARPISAFSFSLGFLNTSIQTLNTKISLSKLSALVSFEIRPLSPNFSLGGQGLTSIPSVEANNYFNHTETMGYLGYTLIERKKWFFEPRGYGYIANGVVKSINQFYVSSNFAVGGAFKYRFSVRNQFSFESLYMDYKGQSIVSVRSSYSRINRNQIGGWGLNFIYQSLGMNVKTKDQSLANQIFFGPYIEF